MRNSRKNKGPALANWLASKFIDDAYLEEFQGDLQEVHEDRIASRGKSYAQWMYWVDTLHLLGGFSSIRLFKNQINSIMIRNMIKIAWRNAISQKQSTILNMLGLVIGITTCFIIGLYVHDEMTYDTFHTNGDRVYRVNQPMIWNNWDEQFASTGPNVAIALREDVPEFEQVTRILDVGGQTINTSGSEDAFNLVIEEDFFAVDPNFFEVFSFEFLKGNPKTALKNPMCMVLTLETAERYFGQVDPLGKTIAVKERDGSWSTYSITGILDNVPGNSHLQFDMLVSMNSYGEILQKNEWKWVWTGFSTYGLVKEGTDIQALSDKIQAIPPKWAAVTTERIFNQTYEEYIGDKQWTLYLQPFQDIYLSDAPGEHRFGPTGKPQFVKIFSAIGLLVLILSSINFMNLSTARSSSRAKEVGIRKVLGSQRNTLVKQFIFESVLFVAVSTIVSLLVVQFSLSGFNAIAEKQLSLVSYLMNPLFLGGVVVFILVLGMLAGSYPAFYLSSFRPITILKGKTLAGFKGKGIRNGLVVFQFTISIALIICTFFVQKQLAHTSSMDLGFAKDNVLQIHNIEQLGFDTEILKTKLASNPAFTHIGKSFAIPPNIWDGERYKAYGPEKPIVEISIFRTEGDYLDLLEVEFIEGRNFDKAQINDKYGVILNEEAVKVLGWGTRETYDSDSPIGKIVVEVFDNEDEMEVLGVVKNFNFSSVREKINPLMMMHHQNDKVWNYGRGASYLSMKLNPASIKNSRDLQLLIENVQEEIAEADESVPFKYSFMDQEFENSFRAERRMSTVLNILTFMTLIIACLGLFGLAAFSAEQRMKELGIRKVLGAKVYQILVLFSSEFTKLIIISILIASPIAYFLVDNWLSDFAYRTSIDIWVFVMATVSALAIAIITISYQSLTTAYKNPVETLKDE